MRLASSSHPGGLGVPRGPYLPFHIQSFLPSPQPSQVRSSFPRDVPKFSFLVMMDPGGRLKLGRAWGLARPGGEGRGWGAELGVGRSEPQVVFLKPFLPNALTHPKAGSMASVVSLQGPCLWAARPSHPWRPGSLLPMPYLWPPSHWNAFSWLHPKASSWGSVGGLWVRPQGRVHRSEHQPCSPPWEAGLGTAGALGQRADGGCRPMVVTSRAPPSGLL